MSKNKKKDSKQGGHGAEEEMSKLRKGHGSSQKTRGGKKPVSMSSQLGGKDLDK